MLEFGNFDKYFNFNDATRRLLNSVFLLTEVSRLAEELSSNLVNLVKLHRNCTSADVFW